MKVVIPALLLLSLASGCGPSGVPDPEVAGTPVHDTDLIADLRMTAMDTTVRLCESGKRYRLVGPALDTIAMRYAYANTRAGQWMKIWFTGHPTVVSAGDHLDSAMSAAKFLHLDASLSCDPVPDRRISGHYKLDSFDPTHPRTVLMDLFADGTALTYTDLHQGQGLIEEDGRWGMDVQDHVNIQWPQRDQTMVFRWNGKDLESDMPGAGRGIKLVYQGSADQTQGSMGRSVRWVIAVAAANGCAVDPRSIDPTTSLSKILTPEAMTALSRTVLDSLQVDAQAMEQQWPAVKTVADLARMMRIHGRRG